MSSVLKCYRAFTCECSCHECIAVFPTCRLEKVCSDQECIADGLKVGKAPGQSFLFSVKSLLCYCTVYSICVFLSPIEPNVYALVRRNRYRSTAGQRVVFGEGHDVACEGIGKHRGHRKKHSFGFVPGAQLCVQSAQAPNSMKSGCTQQLPPRQSQIESVACERDEF